MYLPQGNLQRNIGMQTFHPYLHCYKYTTGISNLTPTDPLKHMVSIWQCLISVLAAALAQCSSEQGIGLQCMSSQQQQEEEGGACREVCRADYLEHRVKTSDHDVLKSHSLLLKFSNCSKFPSFQTMVALNC